MKKYVFKALTTILLIGQLILPLQNVYAVAKDNVIITGDNANIVVKGRIGASTTEPPGPPIGPPTYPGGPGGRPNIPGSVISVEEEHDFTSLKAYIHGYPDGSFRPENPITRGEVATILYSLISDSVDIYEEVVSVFNSDDVNENLYYWYAINYLANNGVIIGYPDRTFRPESYITRAEIVTLVTKMMHKEESSFDLDVFSDLEKGHWAYGFICSAYENGFIKGYPDKTFKPDQHITRAETVVIINQATGRSEYRNLFGDHTKSKFYDVSNEHWAFIDIMLASSDLMLSDRIILSLQNSMYALVTQASKKFFNF